MNRRGYSTGFSWIFGLVSVFGLGVLYIIFNQVLTVHLVPTIKNAVNNTGNVPNATIILVNANIDKFMNYFHLMPYILLFVIILYMGVTAFRKEGESQYY